MLSVNVKSALASKINWTQALGFAAMALTYFGIDLPADVQNQMLILIGAVQSVVTWVLRTWFTSAVTSAVEKRMSK